MFLMWVEIKSPPRDWERDVLIITVASVASLPGALCRFGIRLCRSAELQAGSVRSFCPDDCIPVLVVSSVIALTQAQRKVSIQYRNAVVGRKVYGGQTQYLPLKVNAVGVMPLIFAQAILLFP